jgi:serine O-acetyltransferase
MNYHEEKLKKIAEKINETAECDYNYFHKQTMMVPSRKEGIEIIKNIQELMFPDYFHLDENKGKSQEDLLDELFIKIKRQITAAWSFCSHCNGKSVVDTEALSYEILSEIPKIKEALIKDVQAIYEGDPAAMAPEEIILSYPGFYAISIYRIAHEFYIRKIPYISRLMTEFAHEKTGIDIHAGATIGEYFFIDHGTGIVIGETTTIGNRVRIYQGVTLGAKSFELDSNGNPVKGVKRHPDIGNNCIIYANATILGGNTKIGDGAVIGGNVWITHSVPAGEVVYYNK